MISAEALADCFDALEACASFGPCDRCSHRAHTRVFEVHEFACIAQQREQLTEDGSHKLRWEVVERQPAHDEVVSREKRGVFDRRVVQLHNDLWVSRAILLEKLLLKKFAEDVVDFDNVELIARA